jgi:serine protease AprX
MRQEGEFRERCMRQQLDEATDPACLGRLGRRYWSAHCFGPSEAAFHLRFLRGRAGVADQSLASKSLWSALWPDEERSQLMARITINGVSLDPVTEAKALQSAALDSADTSETQFVLVQTQGPLEPDQRSRLEEAGAVIDEYIPQHTYLCRYEPKDLTTVRSLPFVVWAGPYLPGFKVPAALRHGAPAEASAMVAPTAAVEASRTPHQIDVVLHAGVDPREMRQEIAEAARVDPEAVDIGKRKARVMVQDRYLPDLAALDEVRHLEPVPKRQLFNNVAGPIMNASVMINGTPYQGDGEIVAVADTGLDKGSTSDVHAAFMGRVAKLYALGRTDPEQMDDPDGHGTHVAGSVLGSGDSPTMGGAIEGTAPAATLVLQSLLDSGGGLGGIPTDLHDLFLPPYNDDGARVHTNSWGATQPGLPYDQSAQEIDDVVWNNPDLVICFAAGNSGTDADGDGVIDAGSVGSEAAAKNCITVGASESNRPDISLTYGGFAPSKFPAEPIQSDSFTNDSDGMGAFSSRGPTQEGRFKPDVTAPGTSILSTLSRAVVNPSTVFGTSSDPLFFFETGTSMATPLTAGCVAVLRGALIQNGTQTPSAALIKALLINGAVELPGQYSPSEAGPSPNNNSGWGRVNLAASVLTPSETAGFADADPLNQGEQNTIEVTIPDGQSLTLKVTLVWTDPPGAALQNDLDLSVAAADGTERHGNMGTDSDFDRVNNVEQVVWEGVPAGSATITVAAFRITTGPQPYAYAWTLS